MASREAQKSLEGLARVGGVTSTPRRAAQVKRMGIVEWYVVLYDNGLCLRQDSDGKSQAW